MKSWFLFFLGTLGYFLHRYIHRKDKQSFDLRFWLQDNWPELLLAFIFDLAAMIIVMDPDTAIDLTQLLSQLPVGLVVSAKLVSAFACGFGIGWGVYTVLKKKVKDQLNNNQSVNP